MHKCFDAALMILDCCYYITVGVLRGACVCSWSVFGQGLNDSLSGGGPPSVGGQLANLTADFLAYAIEVANDEINHVAFLR